MFDAALHFYSTVNLVLNGCVSVGGFVLVMVVAGW